MSNDDRLPNLLDEILCTALAVGLVLVLLLPAARAVTAIGWLPMWLVGMPAVAWWALRGFPLPGAAAHVETRILRRPRSVRLQAKHTPRHARRRDLRQVA